MLRLVNGLRLKMLDEKDKAFIDLFRDFIKSPEGQKALKEAFENLVTK